MQEIFVWESLCAVRLKIESIVDPVGPAGDALFFAFRILHGSVTGLSAEKSVLGGSDFATMRADEVLRHDGRFLVRDPAGDINFTYRGTSRAPKGAYDRILSGHLPGSIRSTLVVCAASSNPRWRLHQRQPLIGLGNLNARGGDFEFALFSLPSSDF